MLSVYPRHYGGCILNHIYSSRPSIFTSRNGTMNETVCGFNHNGLLSSQALEGMKRTFLIICIMKM